MQLELRQAIEPWHVIGDDANSGSSSRTVDASMERIQVTLRGADRANASSYEVTCNHYRIPLVKTALPGEWVGGVRFRARQKAFVSHPAVSPHRSLVFEVVERQTRRSLGGCTYYPSSPHQKGDRSFPTNRAEAEARMTERFIPHGLRPEPSPCHYAPISPEYPTTLDLRRASIPW